MQHLAGESPGTSREEYFKFLRDLQARRNANREKPFAEEQAVLRELPPRRLESSRRLTRIPVSKGSTIQVQQNTYSVHSRLMGEEVDVVIGMEHVEVWYAP